MDGINWIISAFEIDETIIIRKTFHLSKQHLSEDSALLVNASKLGEGKESDAHYQDILEFKLAKKNTEYFHVDREIVQTKYDVLLHQSIFICINHRAHINPEVVPNINSVKDLFCADNNTSIFSGIDELCSPS